MPGRSRQGRGTPPGKKADPLGDQITWEQFLNAAAHHRQFWIISKDGDYLDRFDRDRFLNASLMRDLGRVVPAELDVRCFDALPAGLTNFIESMGLDDVKLPSARELAQIQ